MLIIGIDVGGTFTDIVIYDEDRRPRTRKALFMVPDPTEGLVAGLRKSGSTGPGQAHRPQHYHRDECDDQRKGAKTVRSSVVDTAMCSSSA